MRPLTLITVPGPTGAFLSARHPGFTLARCGSLPLGLGLVLPLLARSPPFSRAPLGLRVPLTAGEITRGQHLLVLKDQHPVAYAGWVECTVEQGARFLGPEGINALDHQSGEGPAMAFLTWLAASPEAMGALKTAMRALYPRRHYFARRSHAAADTQGARQVVPRGGVITPLVIAQASGQQE